MITNKNLRNLFASTILATAFSVASFNGANLSPAHAQDMNRTEVEKIIREYLLANPELMLEVQDALEKKQDEITQVKREKTLSDQHASIYDTGNLFVIGNKEAKHTVVEFFDYNCGYCQRAMNDMNKLVAQNPDIKFILKEFPVLGEASLEAHKVSSALARSYPDLYSKFHTKLLGGSGRKDGAKAMEVAVALGADKVKLTKAMEDDVIIQDFQSIYTLADNLGIAGTPAYIIGKEVHPGAIGYDQLSPMIKNLKSCGNASC